MSQRNVPITTQVTASFLENKMDVGISTLKPIVLTKIAEIDLVPEDTPKTANLAKHVATKADAPTNIQLQIMTM